MYLCAVIQTSALITDPTWVFFLVLVIILSAPLLLRRLRIPPIIGLMLAGVLIGPFGFNVFERDRSFEIFGQVGIYYIMFLAALELDMGSVSHYGRRGLQFGLLTFLFPFALGFLSARYVLHYGPETSMLLACILASHTLVSYPIVGRYGIGRHRSVVISVVATAIAIFLALLMVAITVGRLHGDADWLYWLLFTLKCVLYGMFVVMVFPRVGRWFLRRYDDSVMQYTFILALVFLSASLAKLVGLEGLLGAFLAGLVVNRLIPRTSPLMNRIEFVGNALFIPYFLIGVGMIIDVNILFSDTNTLWVVAVIVVAATLGKWLAAVIMTITSSGDRDSGTLMFGLTNAHAAGALAIVMIGTDPSVQLMDNAVLNGTVMLILFSCIISSLATNRGARRLVLKDTQFEENRGSYHGRCLVTYSREENVDSLTQLAMLIRNPYIPESLIGLTVSFDDEMGKKQHQLARKILDKAQDAAAAADIQMVTLNRVSTNIVSGILHTMTENDCGEVIMSLSDQTNDLPKASLGTIIDNILEGTRREVIVMRCIVPAGTLRRVIIAVPQKAEYEVGFFKWLEHVSRIGEQLDCHLEFHAHPDTLPYIQGYMQQKHGNLRSEFVEMDRWTHILQLASRSSMDHMFIFVTARQGSISYQSRFDSLPQIIHRHFSRTSVIMLYPDQWGEPTETLSIFQPNGRVVTRRSSWLTKLFSKKLQ